MRVAYAGVTTSIRDPDLSAEEIARTTSAPYTENQFLDNMAA